MVTKARSGPVPVYLNGLGNVTAFYTVTVRSRVDGQLMSIGFKEGESVKKDQVLAEIDPRPFEVQLQQAQGTLARDTASLANAKLDLERYTQLLAQDAIPKQQLDTQRALVSQLEGNIKTDEANVNNARLQLTYAKVTAPISGTIGLRLVDPGNIVRAADPGGLLVITQLQPISTLFTIPEDSLPQVMAQIRKGHRLTVEAFNRDNTKKLATGYLLTVDNQIDASTGTSKLKGVFENKDNSLFPNQFVNARLLVETLSDATVVPAVAVQHGPDSNFVYVVQADSTVALRKVEAGPAQGDVVTIAAGLEPGDVVVKFDGKDIKEMRDLPRIVADTPVGRDVAVVIVRKGKEETKTVKLGRLDDEKPVKASATPAPADAALKRSVNVMSLFVTWAPVLQPMTTIRCGSARPRAASASTPARTSRCMCLKYPPTTSR